MVAAAVDEETDNGHINLIKCDLHGESRVHFLQTVFDCGHRRKVNLLRVCSRISLKMRPNAFSDHILMTREDELKSDTE